MKTKYNFIKYQSIYDESITVFALERDGVESTKDNVRFIEVTPDFNRVFMIRADSLKPVGKITKEY